MSRPQHLLLPRASRLATDLRGAVPGLKKSAFLSVLAGFQSERDPDPDKLQRLLRLVAKGSGGHLQRGESYPEQVLAVVEHVLALLDEGEYQPQELKTVFGWTARLLLVGKEDRTDKQNDKKPRTQESSPLQAARKPEAGLTTLSFPTLQPATKADAPALSKGQKVDATVKSLENGVYTLVLKLTGQEVTLKDKGYPWSPGDKCKVRVLKLDAKGQVLEVAP